MSAPVASRRLRSARGRRVVAVILAGAALLVSAPPALATSSSPSPSPSGSGTPKLNDTPNKVTFGIGPAGKIKVNDAGVIKTIMGVDGRPYFYYLVTPGGALSDHVAIQNIAFAPVTLRVYPTDALNGPDGSFGLLAAAKAPVDAGAWVTMKTPTGNRSVVIPARSTVVLPLTLAVPKGASPGDHTAGVVASLQSQAKTKQGDVVTLDQRVAVRMFIRVAGKLKPELSVENLSAVYHGTLNPFGKGTATVTYIVHNTGNLKLGGRQRVEVGGLFGSTGSPTAIADIPLLLPGGSIKVTVDVPGILPEIWMTGTVKIEPLSLRGDVDPGLAEFSQSTHFWAIPWALVALMLLIVGYIYWRIRRRRLGANPEDGDSTDDMLVPEGVSS